MSNTTWGMDPRTNEKKKKNNPGKKHVKKKKNPQWGQKIDSIAHDSSQSQRNP